MSLFPGVSSCHTTYTLEPETAICGAPEGRALLLKLTPAFHVAPLSVLLRIMISACKVFSCHTTYTLEPETAICALREMLALLLRLTIVFHVAPLSVLLRIKMSLLPVVLSDHTTYTLEPETAICGGSDLPALLLRFTTTF